MKLFGNLKKEYGGRKAFVLHILNKLRYFTLGFSYVDKLPKSIKGRRIVFVCKGNICRSALAHQYLAQLSKHETVSFGLDTHTGKHANQRIKEVSLKRNISLENHRTCNYDDYNYIDDDIIICMEPYQCRKAKELYPNATVSLLGLQLPEKRVYIHDPYAACEEYVERCVDLIVSAVQTLKSNHLLDS